jgi:hypothetical protein
LRTKEKSAINLLNNNKNSNPTLNNKNNPINNIYPKNPNNSLINHKSNLYSAMNQDQRPLDDFSEYMFEQINKIRVNPKSFVDKFKKAKDCIKRDKKGNLYYSGKMKVALYQGKEAFEEAILSLEKMKPMKPLIYKKDLCRFVRFVFVFKTLSAFFCRIAARPPAARTESDTVVTRCENSFQLFFRLSLFYSFIFLIFYFLKAWILKVKLQVER